MLFSIKKKPIFKIIRSYKGEPLLQLTKNIKKLHKPMFFLSPKCSNLNNLLFKRFNYSTEVFSRNKCEI
jgi:hypothetical protein